MPCPLSLGYWPRSTMLMMSSCHLSGQWCRSKSGLMQHRYRVHGEAGPAVVSRSCILGTVCPTCGGDYRTRTRLVRHVTHGAAVCVAALMEGRLALVDPAAAATADAADKHRKADRRKAGLRDHAGLPHIRPAARPMVEAAVVLAASGVWPS